MHGRTFDDLEAALAAKNVDRRQRVYKVLDKYVLASSATLALATAASAMGVQPILMDPKQPSWLGKTIDDALLGESVESQQKLAQFFKRLGRR